MLKSLALASSTQIHIKFPKEGSRLLPKRFLAMQTHTFHCPWFDSSVCRKITYIGHVVKRAL